MKYLDRPNRLSSRLSDTEQRVEPLLEGMLQNQRIFSEADTNPPEVTDAIRYEQVPKNKLNPPKSPPTEGVAADIFELYEDQKEFDAPLRFQKESWETISEQLQQLNRSNRTRGVLTTAPTGFGKTEAFMGPIVRALADGMSQTNTAVFVYPRQALLKDQLQRILRLTHQIKTTSLDLSTPQVGVYYSDIPYYEDDISDSNEIYNPHTNIFELTRSWETDEHGEIKPFFLNPDQKSGYLRTPNGSISFRDDELLLNRSSIVFSPPNIVLTTLSSLENFSLKVNYNILDYVDVIVFDEVHLYSGIYGAHAANVIQNLNRLKSRNDDAVLFVGSSATLGAPKRFANKIFGLQPSDVDVIEPPQEDYVPTEEVDDYENYYFLQSSEDVALATTYIQQSMLLGHTLLNPQNDSPQKMLSFIDSISSVNQKYAQFLDADQRERYWELHVGRDEADWEMTATKMESEFIHRPLNVNIDHSEIELTMNDIDAADMLISTSSLEVGIDIGELNVIGQYHAPQNLSSFLQRAGRAGRGGGDSHIVTYLGQDEGDSNYFHRADRFLDSEVTTPLNPENPIVQWIHESFYKYYIISDQLNKAGTPGREFLKRYFTKDVEVTETRCVYPSFAEFLTGPSDYVSHELGNPPANLLSTRPIDSLLDDIGQHMDGLLAELEPLAAEMDESTESLIQRASPESKVISNLQDHGSQAVTELKSRLTDLQDAYGAQQINVDLREEAHLLELPGYGEQDVTVEKLSSYARTLIDTFEKGNPDDIEETFRRLRRIFQIMDTVAGSAGTHYDSSGEGVSYDYGAAEIDRFQELYNTYRKDAGKRITELHEEWRRAYYLNESLEQLRDYFGTPGESYESVYAVKFLLRSLYYFDRYLSIDDRDEDAMVWYVPRSYYGETGSTFTRVTSEKDGSADPTEQPVYKLAQQYYPYRGEFANTGSDIHIFQPRTELEGGELYFDIEGAEDVSSRPVGEDIVRPDSITVDRVADCSGESARGVLPYCPSCLEILDGPSDTCDRHNDSAFGTFYATPQLLTTRIDESDQQTVSPNLQLGDFEMKIALDAVDIDVRRMGYRKDLDSYVPQKEERQPDPQTVHFRDTRRLGFQLNTRGLVWDLEEYLETLDENEEVRKVYDTVSSSDGDQFEETALHTAAHFLTVLTADVCGVDVDLLMYDYDTDDYTVTVFELAEGGQGIVDLMVEELTSSPSKVLESVHRVGYDPQVITEAIWKDQRFQDRILTALRGDPPSDLEAEVRSAIKTADAWTAPTHNVENRVIEEMAADVDRLRDTHTRCQELGEDISTSEIITLRGEIADRLLENGSVEQVLARRDFPSEIVTQIQDTIVTEHIDGCHSTLQIQNCMEEGPSTEQHESLSYAILRGLRDHLLQDRNPIDISETFIEEPILPSKLTDDESTYISF